MTHEATISFVLKIATSSYKTQKNPRTPIFYVKLKGKDSILSHLSKQEISVPHTKNE